MEYGGILDVDLLRGRLYVRAEEFREVSCGGLFFDGLYDGLECE